MESRQPSGPRLALEAENERHKAWPATDRQQGWPYSLGDASIGARPGTRCALTPSIEVAEIGEAWTHREANSGG